MEKSKKYLFGILILLAGILIGMYLCQLSKPVDHIDTSSVIKTPEKEEMITAISTDTSDWKTYSDTVNGFEFRYPSKYTLRNDNGTIDFVDEEANKKRYEILGGGDSPGLGFYIKFNKSNNILEFFECERGYKSCPEFKPVDIKSVDNVDYLSINSLECPYADYFTYKGEMRSYSGYVVSNCGDKPASVLFHTDGIDGTEKEYHYILSTFRFTK